MPQTGNRGYLRASEAIAVAHLESLGFKILDIHKKLILNGVEVSDIDVVAERNGVLHAIEVKSGVVDVDAVRQAYVNAKVTGMKPVVVGRGIADERARVLAEELGVEVITLSDLLLVSSSELREAVYEAVYSALNDILSHLVSCEYRDPDTMRVLEALASSTTITEIAEKLGVTEREAVSAIASLSDKGELPRGSLRLLSLIAKAKLLCIAIKTNMQV